ncbi:hypothetical protein LA080_011782 [Diaporthe eres]|nr:hypothetical protein LA080_011782 [Diaporthe eres]
MKPLPLAIAGYQLGLYHTSLHAAIETSAISPICSISTVDLAAPVTTGAFVTNVTALSAPTLSYSYGVIVISDDFDESVIEVLDDLEDTDSSVYKWSSDEEYSSEAASDISMSFLDGDSGRDHTKLEGSAGLFADHIKQECDLIDRTKVRDVFIDTFSRQYKLKRFKAVLSRDMERGHAVAIVWQSLPVTPAFSTPQGRKVPVPELAWQVETKLGAYQSRRKTFDFRDLVFLFEKYGQYIREWSIRLDEKLRMGFFIIF